MKNDGKEITREEILMYWRHGKTELDWRQLTDRGKRAWLQACLAWSDLPDAKIKSFHYILDGTQVNSKIDFYCLLGEAFFGYRGYFGQDAHGFDDCFTEIWINTRDQQVVEPGATIVFKNRQRIAAALGDSFEYILKIFTKHGFSVQD